MNRLPQILNSRAIELEPDEIVIIGFKPGGRPTIFVANPIDLKNITPYYESVMVLRDANELNARPKTDA